MLSAVDAHTAHALLVNCLQGDILKGRTVLMVSHHTALVSPAAAFIVALENVSLVEETPLTVFQGAVKFAGTRSDFVSNGLMEELDNEEAASPIEPKVAAIDISIKPSNKSLVSLITTDQDPDSETSSLAPDDEDTLVSSDNEMKKQRKPRKLMEDEKRAKGRIARVVWLTYFKVSVLDRSKLN